MNSTFYENVLANLLVNLEHYLPMLAARIVAFLVICFIWPKLTKLIIKSLDKALLLRNNDPLLISFLKSLLKTVMYIILGFILVGILGLRATKGKYRLYSISDNELNKNRYLKTEFEIKE